jgi:DNA polymerase III epsilon subunit-like protein
MNIDIRALCAFLGLSEFVSVDIETTGLDPQENEIIEVAAVRFSDQGQEGFSIFCKTPCRNSGDNNSINRN